MINGSNAATVVNHNWENYFSTLALVVPLTFCLSPIANAAVQPLTKEIIKVFSTDSSTRIVEGEDMVEKYISTFTSFVETILCESKDLPAEFAQILEENFMDILAKE